MIWTVMMNGVIGLGLAHGTAAGGDGYPDTIAIYDFEQVLIGDLGNRNTTGEETAWFGNPGGIEIGGVDYYFRLSRLELTVGQHLEFVEAYLPFYLKNTGNQLINDSFGGRSIRLTGDVAVIRTGHTPEIPSRFDWEYMARFVNWLHHGKLNDEWAFESGVYDTSTLVVDD